jgi:hypothetical protein
MALAEFTPIQLTQLLFLWYSNVLKHIFRIFLNNYYHPKLRIKHIFMSYSTCTYIHIYIFIYNIYIYIHRFIPIFDPKFIPSLFVRRAMVLVASQPGASLLEPPWSSPWNASRRWRRFHPFWDGWILKNWWEIWWKWRFLTMAMVIYIIYTYYIYYILYIIYVL